MSLKQATQNMGNNIEKDLISLKPSTDNFVLVFLSWIPVILVPIQYLFLNTLYYLPD